MGGFNSGRTGGYPTFEGCGSYVLSMKSFRGQLRRGVVGKASATFGRGGSEEIAVSMRIDTRPDAFWCFELEHETRGHAVERIVYKVGLQVTKPTYGGERWWFVCPATWSRSYKLYLPRGGRQFLSRSAYRLGYLSTRVDKLMRCQRRAMKILAKLGQPNANWLDWAPKPKWMRWATYERLHTELESVQADGNAVWTAAAMRRFGIHAVGLD